MSQEPEQDEHGNRPLEGKTKIYMTQKEYELFLKYGFFQSNSGQESYFKTVELMFGRMALAMIKGREIQPLVVPLVTLRIEVVDGKKTVGRLFEGKIIK